MNFNTQDFNYTTVPISKISTVGSIDEDESIYKNYEIREQDRWLPLANVGRVMKNALPQQAKLSKESKMCIQECVSEFISFITSGAVDKCQTEKRKTLNGEDILYALHTLGFENYAEALKIYLAKFREVSEPVGLDDSTIVIKILITLKHENLEANQRREKDKRKRQLRKEKKEHERIIQERQRGFQRDNRNSSINEQLLNPLSEENDISQEMEITSYEEENLDYSVLENEPRIDEGYVPVSNFNEEL